MPLGSELRRYVRIAVERPVYVTTPVEGIKTHSIWSYELGEGGCLLVSEQFFGVGRVMVVDVVLDSRRPVRAIGKVIYEYRDLTSKVCSGVEFQYIDNEHLECLRDYIEARSVQEAAVASA